MAALGLRDRIAIQTQFRPGTDLYKKIVMKGRRNWMTNLSPEFLRYSTPRVRAHEALVPVIMSSPSTPQAILVAVVSVVAVRPLDRTIRMFSN